jgi:Fur family transcriptional regulator, zinc uptake regulator
MSRSSHLHDTSCTACATPDLAFARHDHGHCQADVLARSDAIAAERGMRLTPVRRRALEVLREAHRALGAYDVLVRLAADGFGNQPPVAYRALEFLVDQGFAHRVDRLNAFVACWHPGEAHTPVFLICQTCKTVAEAPATAVRVAVDQAAGALGFVVERLNAEVLGLCPACQDAKT